LYFPHSLELFIVAISQVFLVLAYFLQLKVLTNLVSPDIFGLFAIVNSIISLIQSSFFLPYGMAVIKYWDSLEISNENLVFTVNKSVKKPFLTCVLLSLFIFTTSKFFDIEFGLILSTGLITGALSGYCYILRGVFTSKRKRILVAFLNLARPVVFLLFITTLSRFFQFELGSLLLILVITDLVVLLFHELLFERKLNQKFFQLIVKEKKNNLIENSILQYSKPFIKTGLVGWLSSSSDRWIILMYLNENILGKYLACFQVGYYSVTQISTALTSFLHPITTSLNLKSSEGYKKLIKYCFLSILFMFFISVIYITGIEIFGENLLTFILGKEYLTLLYLIPLMIIWGFSFSALNIISLIPISSGNSELLPTPKIFFSILNILTTLFSLIYLDLKMMILFFIISNTFYLCWLFFTSIKQIKINIR
jgi:O-antigen/teichoic acid export membrane protein